jgi:PadR family transcriptional regulator PadR
MSPRESKPLKDAVDEATRAAKTPRPARRKGGGRSADAFGSEMRRRDLLPMLVLHLIRTEKTYGNYLIEAIESLTQGVITVNPNTMYPLLRDLEGRGLIEGDWEHPDKRTRRFYSITAEGEAEYGRLVEEIEPFLDSLTRSISLIKAEVYGHQQPPKRQ